MLLVVFASLDIVDKTLFPEFLESERQADGFESMTLLPHGIYCPYQTFYCYD